MSPREAKRLTGMVNHRFLRDVYKLTKNSDVISHYDATASRYDAVLLDEIGYVAPEQSAALFARTAEDRQMRILDIACGTGLVGDALAKRGYSQLDGVDFSAEMLEQAKHKSIYRRLLQVDLNAPIPIRDNAYDAALCVGSLSDAHVQRHAVAEMCRVIRPGGILLLTLNQHAIEEQHFGETFQALIADGVMTEVAAHRAAYHTQEGIDGDYLVFEIGS